MGGSHETLRKSPSTTPPFLLPQVRPLMVKVASTRLLTLAEKHYT